MSLDYFKDITIHLKPAEIGQAEIYAIYDNLKIFLINYDESNYNWIKRRLNQISIWDYDCYIKVDCDANSSDVFKFLDEFITHLEKWCLWVKLHVERT